MMVDPIHDPAAVKPAPTLAEELAALKAARRSGVRRVRINEREIEFKSDSELAAAIAALQAEIDADNPRPRNVVFRSSPDRGW